MSATPRSPANQASLRALLCFGLALLAVLAANVPPGNAQPMICFMVAIVLGVTGLGFRFKALRLLAQQHRDKR